MMAYDDLPSRLQRCGETTTSLPAAGNCFDRVDFGDIKVIPRELLLAFGACRFPYVAGREV